MSDPWLPPSLLGTAVALGEALRDPLFLRARELVEDEGRCAWFDGMGGTGKSYDLRFACAYFKFARKMKVACTASTGCAAVGYAEFGLRGCTLHSFAGIGLGKTPAEGVVCMLRNGAPTKFEQIVQLQVLAIDEISMISAEVFELVDRVFRLARGRLQEPFGGVSVIVSGDFLQLPPVEGKWVFKSPAWAACRFERLEFTEPRRYRDDPRYFEMMGRIRQGVRLPEDMALLRGRVGLRRKGHVAPTTLFPTRKQADNENRARLAALPGGSRTFFAKDAWTDLRKRGKREPKMPDRWARQLDDAIPSSLELKIGAQVMLRKNLNVGAGHVNGTRGIVNAVRGDVVTMELINGSLLDVTTASWTVGTEDEIAERTQLPLILAWAFTIHKSQSCTLDAARVYAGTSVFAPGMAYVALSRVRRLTDLYLSAFDEDAVRCDEEARAFLAECKADDPGTQLAPYVPKPPQEKEEEKEEEEESRQPPRKLRRLDGVGNGLLTILEILGQEEKEEEEGARQPARKRRRLDDDAAPDPINQSEAIS